MKMKFCQSCDCELPDYLESEIDLCFSCMFNNSNCCEVCSEVININDIDKANFMLGDDWIEMCDKCAKEFYENRKINNTRRS